MTEFIADHKGDPENITDRLYFATYMTRSQILRTCSTESCIISTRIMCEVVRRMGHRAMPLACEVKILNAPATEAMLTGREFDPNSDGPERGLAIAYHPERSDDKWYCGHVALLCLTDEGNFLIDPSIDQVNRPEWDIAVPPLALELSDEQVSAEGFLGGERAMLVLPNGIGLIYEGHVEDTIYQQANDWQAPLEDDLDAQEIIESVIGLLATADEYGEFPKLPPLTTSVSGKAMDVLMAASAEGIPMAEVTAELQKHGFSVQDQVERLAEVIGRERGGEWSER